MYIFLLTALVLHSIYAYVAYDSVMKMHKFFPVLAVTVSIICHLFYSNIIKSLPTKHQIFELGLWYDSLVVLVWIVVPILLQNLKLTPLMWFATVLIATGLGIFKFQLK